MRLDSSRPRLALLAVSARYSAFVLPCAAREVRHWRRRAASIPDRRLRTAALDTLVQKRFSIDGAALFATIVPGFNLRSLRLLVAFQVLCDYLDSISEWHGPNQVESGRLLHRALIQALDPSAPLSDHYALHPHRDDGGYIRALIDACRRAAPSLPSYDRVRSQVVRETGQVEVQALNHDRDPDRRTAALQQWVDRHSAKGTGALWFELSGAAGLPLHIHMLLALAADPSTTPTDVARAVAAYVPWVCTTATMLDSLVDRDRDAASGDDSYVAYYDDERHLTERVVLLVHRARQEVLALRHGERHAVLLAGMAAMYLSEPSAYAADLRRTRRAILAAAGPPMLPILAIMRLWRALRAWRAPGAPLSDAEGHRCGPS
jgi:tetraprenyl-beta-curcumene synthase